MTENQTSPNYSPASVTVRRDGNGWTVVDATYAPAWEQTYDNKADAIARRNRRRGVVKAALTRRANKRTAALATLRRDAAADTERNPR